MILDRLKVVLPEKDKEEGEKGGKAVLLEWWCFRPEHVLWNNTPGERLPVPDISTKAEPKHWWPSNATEAWMEKQKRVLSRLREARVEQYKKYLLRESIGGSFHHARQRTLRDTAREFWPVRKVMNTDVVEGATPEVVGMHEVANLRRFYDSQRRPVDEEEQAARLGVDVYIVKLVGKAWDLRELIPAEDWAKYQTIEPKLPVLTKWSNCDSAVRAWISSLGGRIPEVHAPIVPPDDVDEIKIVYVPNAGGKSFISTRFRNCLDMDVPVYRIVGWTERNVRYDDGIKTHLRECEVSLLDAIAQKKPVLLSQWSPWLLEAAAQGLKIKHSKYYYCVDEEIRRARLIEREWNEDKINEYLGWARENYKTCEHLGWTKVDTWNVIANMAGYLWL